MVSGRFGHQLRWRLVLSGETVSHTGAVQWVKMERAERTDSLSDELQPRPHARNQSGRSVLSKHVPVPLHAPTVAYSMERDQCAKEEGLGVRVT